MSENDPLQPSATSAGDTEVIPLVEDQVRVSTRDVVTGRVRVSTVTDTVEEMVGQELQGIRAEVERVPVDQLLDPGSPPPQPRIESGVTVVPIVEEVLIVEKRLLLKEEVRITLRDTTEYVEVPVQLRRQRAVVERSEGPGAPAPDQPDQAEPEGRG
ncbi:MAG: YsnF/AvaK domain-containing protein [Rhodospirillales bacterium]|nr:YsnF/AvaK domain-containing protein [Rhodospirillales bacterium]